MICRLRPATITNDVAGSVVHRPSGWSGTRTKLERNGVGVASSLGDLAQAQKRAQKRIAPALPAIPKLGSQAHPSSVCPGRNRGKGPTAASKPGVPEGAITSIPCPHKTRCSTPAANHSLTLDSPVLFHLPPERGDCFSASPPNAPPLHWFGRFSFLHHNLLSRWVRSVIRLPPQVRFSTLDQILGSGFKA